MEIILYVGIRQEQGKSRSWNKEINFGIQYLSNRQGRCKVS